MTEKKELDIPNPVLFNPNFICLTNPDKSLYTDEQYLRSFGLLPDFVLKKNGLIPQEITPDNFGNLGTLLEEYRAMFKAIREWLIYGIGFSKLPIKIDLVLPVDLIFSWKLDYEPMARMSWDLLHLCQEILERDPLRWQYYYENLTPRQLWFNAELDSLEKTFRQNGLLGEYNFTGKEKNYLQKSTEIRNNRQSLLKRQFQLLPDTEIENKPENNSVVDALFAYADTIAQKDEYFQWYIYEPYWKNTTKNFRTIRDNKNIQVTGLTKANEIWVGGKGKRGKGKKK